MIQRQAGEDLKISERQVRRLLANLRKNSDKAVVHGLRRRSNRRIKQEDREKAIKILSGTYTKALALRWAPSTC
jgi:hypothetical protein